MTNQWKPARFVGWFPAFGIVVSEFEIVRAWKWYGICQRIIRIILLKILQLVKYFRKFTEIRDKRAIICLLKKPTSSGRENE